MNEDYLLKYRAQHQHRLNYMPWLYFRLKAQHAAWAKQWQQDYQNYLCDMEDISIGNNCFISPLAHIFAEPGRRIEIGDGSFVAADSVLHGPLKIGAEVAINHHCTLDGGRAGVQIGAHTRIAAHSQLYAFNHGMKPEQPIYQQTVSSRGIVIGEDVWLGAGVGIVDGIQIGHSAIVGMHSVVTHNVADFMIVAGNPAQVIGDRRLKK